MTTPDTTTPDTTELDRQAPGAALLAERQRLTSQIAALRTELGLSPGAVGLTEMERYGQHPSDLASETVEREIDLSIELDLSEQLREVDAALHASKPERTESARPAVSRSTPARLAAMPAARRCTTDQQTAEQFSDHAGQLNVPSRFMQDTTSSDDEDDVGRHTSNEELSIHLESS